MEVETSEANLWSVKSVSKIEMEWMASFRVLGFFGAFEMCSNAVGRLSYVKVVPKHRLELGQ